MNGQMPGKLISADAYAAVYANGGSFEDVCARARQNRAIRFLQRYEPDAVLEVGCGRLVMIERIRREDLAVKRFVTVEPVAPFADLAMRAAACDPRFAVVGGYVETCEAKLAALAPGGYDAALLSSVIHETTAPLELIASTSSLVKQGGHIFVTVPNANSFHRMLAVEMGLISAPTDLGARNRLLGQPTVYTRESLYALLEKAGLKPLEFDGYLFKPFTNDQMDAVRGMLPDGVMEALEALGRAFPDHAAEICVTCEK